MQIGPFAALVTALSLVHPLSFVSPPCPPMTRLPAPAAEAPPVLAAIDCWIFDLDNTLYPPGCGLFAQIDRRMGEFIGKLLGLDRAGARALQKRYFRDHGTTLNGLMINHGVAPGTFLDYVHDIDLSALPPAPALDRALARLPGRRIVYTNGSAGHAERVIARLGVGHHFDAIHDIEAADFRPKPFLDAYQGLVARYRFDPRAAAMLDDSVANLRPAAMSGTTTVWVRPAATVTGADAGHVDHVTDDVVAWIERATLD